MEKTIIYFGQPAKVSCDEKCEKAWGISERKTISLSDDEDDFAWLSDNELGEAPENPGTYIPVIDLLKARIDSLNEQLLAL